MSNSWQCPFCGHHASIQDEDISSGRELLHEESRYDRVGLTYQSIRCPNTECQEVILSVAFNKVTYEGITKFAPISSWQLLPESNAKPQPDCIPEPIRIDYHEACLIQHKSPKASATLSRRCLQGMIRDFWQIKEKNLYQEISKLKDLIDVEVWEAIDAIRSVGNIGAHMETDINIIVEVDPDEAGLLIELIEQLFEEWYVKKHQRDERMSRIKALAESKNADKAGNDDGPNVEEAS